MMSPSPTLVQNSYRWLIAGSLILIALCLSVGFALQQCSRAVGNIAEIVERPFKGTVDLVNEVFLEGLQLRPKIHVSETLVQGQESPIAELAITEKDFMFEYCWKHVWAKSEKEIIIRGVFTAKAGYDLHEPFEVLIGPEGKVSAKLPPAKILSIEQKGELHFDDSEGWWNTITPEDKNTAINEFLNHSKDNIRKSDLAASAEKQSLERLTQLAEKNGFLMEVAVERTIAD